MIGMAEQDPAVVVGAADMGIFACERGMVSCTKIAGRVWAPILVVSACLADSAKGYFVPLTIVVGGERAKMNCPSLEGEGVLLGGPWLAKILGMRFMICDGMG